MTVGGATLDLLRAEHGFSALIDVNRGVRTHRVLYDAGVSPGHQAWRAGRWQHDPLVHDDQALAAHVRGAGW